MTAYEPSSIRKKRGGLLAAMLAFTGLATGAAAAPAAVTLEQAPHEWVVYAQSAMEVVAGWLNGEVAPGPRLREYFFKHASDQGQNPQPLLLKLWVGGDGAVTRVESQSLGDEQAEKDLQTLLLGQRLAPPPKNILLPMRVAVQLAPPKTSGKK